MNTNPDIYIPAGESGHDQFEADVTPERAGWTWSGIKVVKLDAGASQELQTGDDEVLVLPLQGGCTVEVDGQSHELAGREGVFKGVTDFVYVPRNKSLIITSAAGGRFAIPTSKATSDLPVARYGKDQVRTDLRGAGDCSRQVNNYALNNGVPTSHLLVCEVLTPGGNWSSYPAHKHEEFSDVERELEEVYYFEVTAGPDGPGFALHRTYGTPERPIDLLAEVHDRDIALVPHGWHGPCVAAPGYDLYYLNVMAGPAEDQVWLAIDDPQHHWIRSTWDEQDIDPRLPFTN
ncbi:5-deoxy-glucuronate isomerase [Luteococcus japonicus]|uniref:5-deoxy-glucuronate isomerase n=1 Tax=Luteococcus japonicus LSP_Lj1 TaxID=1255658 RepID=A0A1R4KDQ1_9ACTN|nr:5-deoxy-glucuronate isomerase [Luteococcus japonicus LSP_Lj1]